MKTRSVNTQKLPEHIHEAVDGLDKIQAKVVEKILVKYSHVFITTDGGLARNGIIQH